MSERKKGQIAKPKFATRTDYEGEVEGTQYPVKTKIRLGVYCIPHSNPEDGCYEIRITKENLSDWRPISTFVHD